MRRPTKVTNEIKMYTQKNKRKIRRRPKKNRIYKIKLNEEKMKKNNNNQRNVKQTHQSDNILTHYLTEVHMIRSECATKRNEVSIQIITDETHAT